MNMKVFSVFDSKAQFFELPFMRRTTAEAIRDFADAVNDKSTKLAVHPEDYTLFQVAEWDSDTAKYATLLTPISLGIGVEYLKVDKIANPIIPQVIKNENA